MILMLLSFMGNMAAWETYCQSNSVNVSTVLCNDPAPSSVTITTNAPKDRTICGSSQWNFDMDYSNGDLYEWKILNPSMGSIVSGMYTPHIEVMFHNAEGKTQRVEVIVAITKCKEIRRDTLIMNVLYFPKYTVTTDTATICAGEPIDFTISPTPSHYDHLIWNFGDGSTSQDANTIHTYQNSDSLSEYKPVATIVNPGGCLATVVLQTGLIIVKPAPVVLLSPGGAIAGCDSLPHGLTATITNKMGGTNNFHLNGPASSNLPHCIDCNTWEVDQYGNYFVTAKNSNGCEGISNSLTIIEDCNERDCPELLLIISGNSHKDCGTVQVNMGYNPRNSNITGQTWTFPKEATNTRFTTGSDATASATFEKPGIYPISYTIDSEDGKCVNTFTQNVYVPYLGDLRYEASCDTGNFYTVKLFDHSQVFPKEAGSIHHLYAYKENGGDWQAIKTYGDAQTAKVQLLPGAYQFREIIYSDQTPHAAPCTTIAELNLPVKPVANFEFETPFTPPCVNEAVQFKNLSSPSDGLKYIWNFGDATTNHQANPAKVFSEWGGTVYSVKLKATNAFGCVSSVDKYVKTMENQLWDGTIKPELFQTTTPSQSSKKSVTLYYFDMFYNTPSKFVWYKGNKQLTPELSSPGFEVTEPGVYWVMGSDQYGCKVPSYPSFVDFTENPPTKTSP